MIGICQRLDRRIWEALNKALFLLYVLDFIDRDIVLAYLCHNIDFGLPGGRVVEQVVVLVTNIFKGSILQAKIHIVN